MEIYVVRPGDTLYSVAENFGTTAGYLAEVNALSDPARLAVGTALIIPTYETAQRRGIEVNAYAYPDIAPAVLAQTLPYLTFLCPFEYSLRADGTLREINDGGMVKSAYATNTAPLMTVTNLSEASGFSSDIAHAVLTDERAQDTALNSILSTLREKKYYGINFNLEYVYPFDKESYNAFLRRAEALFHPLGYYLTSAIAPKESDGQGGILYEAHDYAAHGKYMDRVVIMTYEWGYTYGAPQAVSPVNKIRAVLDYAVTRIPRGKILMGFSNYGYNWLLPWRQGEAASIVSSSGATNLAAAVGAQIRYDALAAAPYFYYTDPARQKHVVWFEDARSWRARCDLAEEYELAGISIWTIDKLYRPGLEVLSGAFDTEKII